MWLSLLFVCFPLALSLGIKRRHGQCEKALVDSWGPSFAACPALRLLGFPCGSFVQGGFFRARLGAELSGWQLVPSLSQELPAAELGPSQWTLRPSACSGEPAEHSQLTGDTASQPERLMCLWCRWAAGVALLLI